ncbi:response regulator [Pedobacter ginsengisoli]|uniref:response regulator n=1 Tax=Pedobacter ginsengisoli TaxID=363852 RepID=UPI0025501CB4|nr:response regulator [Pedobacter ginsengisoli]
MKELKPKGILIIENDESVLELLQEIFKNEGYETHCYRQADDIFKLVDDFKPDLVLLDYILPGINGGELCAQLKKDPETRHIPVVICSAYPQVMLSLGSYGCNAFIAKPFELTDMVAQIEDCIKNPDQVFSGRYQRSARV